MVGDGESVGLVTHALQEVKGLTRPGKDHRQVLTRQPDLLQPLGQPADRHVVHAQLVQRALGRRRLGRAAVHDDQVGRVGELARPAGLRVDGRSGAGIEVGVGAEGRVGLGVELPGGRTLLQIALEPA